MACKYYSHNFGKGWCKAGSSETSVDYSTEQKYCTDDSWYQKCPKYPSSGGCFLTSACVTAKGLPDDCEELTVLRNFRDGWLKNQPNGEEEVKQYYEIAPTIVKAIDSSANSQKVYESIYVEYIIPCVFNIKTGQNEVAYKLYKKMVNDLSKVYLHPSVNCSAS